MGIVLAATGGLVVWIVLWTLDVKAIDSFLLTVVILLCAVLVRTLLPYLPGNRAADR